MIYSNNSMSINWNSASSLGRWRAKNGVQRAQANAVTVPSYILRCRYKRQILAQKESILEQMRVVAPVKLRRMETTGFDVLVDTMSDTLFTVFTERAERLGVVGAYLETVKPANYHPR